MMHLTLHELNMIFAELRAFERCSEFNNHFSVDLKYDFNVSETNRFYCLTSSSQSVYPYNGGYFSTALSSPFISPLSIDRIPMV